MNKTRRAERAAAEALARDKALDEEIQRAVEPLRLTAAEVERFDAGPDLPLPALPPRRAAGLVRSLRRALASLDAPQPAETAPAAFGDLIRQGRERARLDVNDVARRLHVHRDYLAGLESGARSPLALGPDGARRLVSILGIPPGAATAALQSAMLASLRPTTSFTARMKRTVPRATRRRVLEDALPTTPDGSHLAEWRALIDAVEDLTR